jgi:hypothetical protein
VMELRFGVPNAARGVRSYRTIPSARPSSSEKETLRRSSVSALQLRTARAYLLQGSSSSSRRTPRLGPNAPGSWCGQTMRSRVEPMKKIARMLRAHRVAGSGGSGLDLAEPRGHQREPSRPPFARTTQGIAFSHARRAHDRSKFITRMLLGCVSYQSLRATA